MRTILTLTVMAASCSFTDAADLESGLTVGEFPPAFTVLDITGPSAGTKLCYRCRYTSRPVVNIFVRKVDENVTRLIKQVDEIVGKNNDNGMAAFVVVLTDAPDAQEAPLKEIAKTHSIAHTPLTVYENTMGPGKYRISKEADVTVMMWVEQDVKVNYAFKSGELNGESIARVVQDTKKILN